MLLDQLNQIIVRKRQQVKTDTYANLHLIAEKLKRRSLVFLFSDMFQNEKDQETMFEALQHLKYNKHEVVLFHTYDGDKELNFDFDNAPKRFIDVETGDSIDVFADNIKQEYASDVKAYFDALKLRCARYNIKYVDANIQKGFAAILSNFLIERQKFL